MVRRKWHRLWSFSGEWLEGRSSELVDSSGDRNELRLRSPCGERLRECLSGLVVSSEIRKVQ